MSTIDPKRKNVNEAPPADLSEATGGVLGIDGSGDLVRVPGLAKALDLTQPFPSLSDFMAATIQPTVHRVSVIVGQVPGAGVRTVAFVRQEGAAFAGLKLGWVPDGDVYADHFADILNNAGDCQEAIENGLAYVAGPSRKFILWLIDGKSYQHSDNIILPMVSDIEIRSETGSREVASNTETRLVCTKPTGPHVQITETGQYIRDVALSGAGARWAAPYTFGAFGLLFEKGTDTSTAAIEGAGLENVVVTNQPCDAIVSSGPAFMLFWNGFATRENKGHSYVISDGTYTGRTFKERPGGFMITGQRSYRDLGYRFLIGEENGFGVYRFTITEADVSEWVAPRDEDICPLPACGVAHGENITFSAYPFTGRVGEDVEYSAIALSGRNIVFDNCRYVGCVSYLMTVPNAAIGSGEIEVRSPYATPDCIFNPAVETVAGTRSVRVTSPARGPTAKVPVSWWTVGFSNGYHDDTTSYDFGSSLLFTRGRMEVDASGEAAFTARRSGASTGFRVVRTGSGAAQGDVRAAGGQIQMGSTTDVDTVLLRNGVARITAKAATINMSSLPTASTGLVAGDLWNDSGTLKVVS